MRSWIRVERSYSTGGLGCCLMVGLTLLLFEAYPLLAAPLVTYLDRQIISVEVVGASSQTTVKDLQEALVTRVGDPLSIEQVRDSIFHLFTIGQFEDVRVEANGHQNGVALRYVVVPKRTVTKIEFKGGLGLSRRRLGQVVRERYGESLALTQTAEATGLLESLYRDNGFMNARIDAVTSIDEESGRATLSFEIESGVRANVGSLKVTGRTLDSSNQLLTQLGLHVGMPFDRLAIRRRLSAYGDSLKEQGHYEAEVNHSITTDLNNTSINLTIHANPGPFVLVQFDNEVLSPEEQEALVPIAREGSIDLDLLDDSIDRIRTHFRRLGYSRVEASYSLQENDEELKIVFHVSPGQIYKITNPEITGNQILSDNVLLEIMDMRAEDVFVEASFNDSVAAIIAVYRLTGYSQVSVKTEVVNSLLASEDPFVNSLLVTPRLTISEGPRVLVQSVTLENAPDEETDLLLELLESKVANPYAQSRVFGDRDRILNYLLSQGYEDASVQVDMAFSEDSTSLDLRLIIDPGVQAVVHHVLVSGHSRVSVETIRRTLGFQSGEALSRERLAEGQQRLNLLGMFNRIRFAEFNHHSDTRRDVLVMVEEVPATVLSYGGGFEAGTRLRRESETGGSAVERFEFAPRGFFEIGRRNLWGKNRSVNLFARVSLRPNDDQVGKGGASGYGFNEYRALFTFREPRVFETSGELVVSAFVDQSIRSSFNLKQQGINIEWRQSFGSGAILSGAYSFDQNTLFDERFNQSDQPLIDRLFPQIGLSAFSGTALRDSRNDPFEPTRGSLISLEAKSAGRRIGSEVGFAKLLMQGFLYRRLPRSTGVVFATGLRLGFARGFSRSIVEIKPSGQATEMVVQNLPASERFFAGGSTTVRGFALDRLGDGSTIDQDGFPQGGNGLFIINNEIRFPIRGPIGAVAFLDLGNVFQGVNDMAVNRIRGGAGFGVRYRSPIGPLRVDVGFKLDRRQFGNRKEGRMVLHVSMGQAF